jgi:hypothetical protein
MNEYAVQLICMPVAKLRAIKKSVAILRRAGIPTNEALRIILDAQRAPYNVSATPKVYAR